MKLKILQASKAYPPYLGGVETIVKQLAEGFGDRDHNSSVLVSSNDKYESQEFTNNVSIYRTPTYKVVLSLPLSPQYPFKLLELVEDIDILQLHEPFLFAPAILKLLEKKLAGKFRKLVVWWHSDIIRQQKLEFLYRPLLENLLEKADAVIVATPNHISSSTFLPKYQHKCHIIPFGIDSHRFKTTPALKDRVLKIRESFNGKPIVLFTGRLVYYKGIEYLVDAMSLIPEAHLIVVGVGPLREKLEQMAIDSHNNISFMSFLQESELLDMYQACDIFVLPSVENSEAFGIVQLEAMACGKPVITADINTGVNYVNQHELTGLVVEKRNPTALADAIKKLIHNPELRSQLGDFAQSRIMRDFTTDKMIDSTINLYQSLLE